MRVTDKHGNTVSYLGVLTLVPQGSGPDATDVTWTWEASGGTFELGLKAQLELQVTTAGLPGGAAASVFCKSIQMEYNPKAGDARTVHLDDVYIAPPGGPYARISLSATRLDWRVRRPGTYAALATEITASGNASLSIQFDGFGSLKPVNGESGAIDAFYSFGRSLPDNLHTLWKPASSLNEESGWIRGLTLDPVEPIKVSMWAKVVVGEDDPPGNYANEGVITFIIDN